MDKLFTILFCLCWSILFFWASLIYHFCLQVYKRKYFMENYDVDNFVITSSFLLRPSRKKCCTQIFFCSKKALTFSLVIFYLALQYWQSKIISQDCTFTICLVITIRNNSWREQFQNVQRAIYFFLTKQNKSSS